MKSKALKFSLIIPVYNESRYIRPLLRSIRASSEQPSEIIFCDNNSTDDTRIQIQKHKHRLPISILTEKQKGILPTVERLWKHAARDLIGKIDADCILPKHWIRNAIRHFNGSPNLDACTGPIVSSDGNMFIRTAVSVGYIVGVPVFFTLKGDMPVYGPNGVFRKTTLKKIQGYAWHTNDLDDHIISRKLTQHHCKVSWYPDMYMFHSTRRFQQRPMAALEAVLSLFRSDYYNERQ